jgi:hypothetical protein
MNEDHFATLQVQHTFWCWGKRKDEGIIARALPCHGGQHVPTHCVKGDMML